LGANVICFGEFDYPPFREDEDGRAAERSFLREVQKRINRSDEPVFAVLGSFHRIRALVDRGSDWTGPLAQNVAKIALSDRLKDSGAAPFREILKRTPASKAGELITGIHGIDMEVFDTIIGKFGVVICSDAYDPSIVLEYFAHSANVEYKRDVILVPSYNKSAKLAHMCQALSLTARSVVVMVDACREHTQALGPFEKSAVWVCGIPVEEATQDVLFGEKHKVCRWLNDSHEDASSAIKILELTLPALDNFVDHMDAVDPLPLFAGVLAGKWG
jgi:predicted amidohydrolase